MSSATPLDHPADRRADPAAIRWHHRPADGGWRRWDRRLPDGREVLPLWIADLDCLPPPAAVEAIQRTAASTALGYSEATSAYLDAVVDWYGRRHGWTARPEWIVTMSGVVNALHLLVRALTRPGDGVVVQPPVYHHFAAAVRDGGATVLEHPLRPDADGVWQMDLDHLEALLARPRTRLLILCSPHNPVGRVWPPEVLRSIASTCAEHDVLVVSDEIHCDLVLPGHGPFVPFVPLAEEAGCRWIVCTSASKTFNLAGLRTSGIVVPDVAERAALREEMRRAGLGPVSPLGIAATTAVYHDGEAWLASLLAGMARNAALLREGLAGTPVRMAGPEATFLAWLDCRALGLDDVALSARLLDAGLLTTAGAGFGSGGGGHQRLIYAMDVPMLEQTIARLRRAADVSRRAPSPPATAPQVRR